MKIKQLLVAAVVAILVSVVLVEHAQAFCLWDYCSDWDGCWWMCW